MICSILHGRNIFSDYGASFSHLQKLSCIVDSWMMSGGASCFFGFMVWRKLFFPCWGSNQQHQCLFIQWCSSSLQSVCRRIIQATVCVCLHLHAWSLALHQCKVLRGVVCCFFASSWRALKLWLLGNPCVSDCGANLFHPENMSERERKLHEMLMTLSTRDAFCWLGTLGFRNAED